MLENLVKIAIMSAPTRSIITHTGMRLRSQLNILILAPYGSGKTTLTRAIEAEGLGVRITRYTYASIIGTITKGGEINAVSIPSLAGQFF